MLHAITGMSILGQTPTGPADSEPSFIPLRRTVAAVTVTSVLAIYAIFVADKPLRWGFGYYYLAFAAVPVTAGFVWFGIARGRRASPAQALAIARLGAMAHGVWAALPAAFFLLLPALVVLYDEAGAVALVVVLAAFLAAPIAALVVTFHMVGAIAQIRLPAGPPVRE